ncbi:MAG: hypothetical protein ACOY82_12515 [Pseudomonadota bacterium]
MATFVFSRSTPDPGARSLQTLFLHRDAQCTLFKGIGHAGLTRLGAKQKSAWAPGGQPVFVSVTTSEWTHGGESPNRDVIVLATRHDCRTFHGFVPEQGHRYSVGHRLSDNRCALEIVDIATGLPPPDLAEHDPAPCRGAP